MVMHVEIDTGEAAMKGLFECGYQPCSMGARWHREMALTMDMTMSLTESGSFWPMSRM